MMLLCVMKMYGSILLTEECVIHIVYNDMLMWTFSWLRGTCIALLFLILSWVVELFTWLCMITWSAQLKFYIVWIPLFDMLWISWIPNYLRLLSIFTMYDISMDLIVLVGAHSLIYYDVVVFELQRSDS